jgi:hypothetical protein
VLIHFGVSMLGMPGMPGGMAAMMDPTLSALESAKTAAKYTGLVDPFVGIAPNPAPGVPPPQVRSSMLVTDATTPFQTGVTGVKYRQDAVVVPAGTDPVTAETMAPPTPGFNILGGSAPAGGGAATPAAGFVTTGASELRAVKLADGTSLSRFAGYLSATGPSGKSFEQRPPPPYQVVEGGPTEYIKKSGLIKKMGMSPGPIGSPYKLRWFEVDGPVVRYYTKEGGELKGEIEYRPGGWVKKLEKGEPRRKDVQPGNRQTGINASIGQHASEFSGTVDENFLIEIHRPVDVSSTINNLMDLKPLDNVFNRSKPKNIVRDGKRSYWLLANNEEEQQEWFDALSNNFQVFQSGGDALEKTIEQFKFILQQVGSNPGQVSDWRSLLNELYS